MNGLIFHFDDIENPNSTNNICSEQHCCTFITNFSFFPCFKFPLKKKVIQDRMSGISLSVTTSISEYIQLRKNFKENILPEIVSLNNRFIYGLFQDLNV